MIVKMDDEQAELVRKLGWLSSVGIVLVVCTFVGLAIGCYLDRWLHTAPWLTLGFLLFGMIAGFWNGFEMIMRCLKEPNVCSQDVKMKARVSENAKN